MFSLELHFSTITLFFTTLSTTFLIISGKSSERDYRKILGSSPKLRDTSSGFRQTSPKVHNIKRHENPCSGNRVVSCGRTDRHDGDSSRFSYLSMHLTMCTGAKHSATPPYTSIAWYKDRVTL